MMRFFTWTGGFVLGSLVGWALSRFGIFVSFMGGIFGTALGVWLGHKLGRHLGG